MPCVCMYIYAVIVHVKPMIMLKEHVVCVYLNSWNLRMYTYIYIYIYYPKQRCTHLQGCHDPPLLHTESVGLVVHFPLEDVAKINTP